MGVQDDYNEAWEAGAKDATERCALLVEMRADISMASARKLREAGSYTVRALWPPLKKSTAVHPKWERAARDMEEVAQAFRVVAKCIRLGYDPRDLDKPKPEDKVDLEMFVPCAKCAAPMDCASWKCCERGEGDRMKQHMRTSYDEEA